jgi:squalene-hopene/tetraprenyl-beta-curcumene cyclase
MMRQRRFALMCFAPLALAALPAVQARGDEVRAPAWEAKTAAGYLDGRTSEWLDWSGSARGQGTACLSCHTSMPIALARPALARQLGEKAPGAAEQRLMDGVRKRVANWDRIVAAAAAVKNPFVPYYGGDRKPSALGTEAVMNALALVNHDTVRGNGVLSAPARKALEHLWGQQQANGAWLWIHFGMNPWENDCAYYGASLAALAVGTAGKEYYEQADVRAKVDALKKYLRTQSAAQPLHHRAVALWASSRLPGVLSAETRMKLIDELLNIQEADGGWSIPKLGKLAARTGNWKSHGVYPTGAVSDGYATGLVVLALRGAGVAAEDARLRKGIAWLAASQKEGAWPIHYPNRPRDPQSNVGKFMRDAATAFAILALTESAGPSGGR